MTDSSVTFYGLAHPTTDAVFAHLRSIVAAVMGEDAIGEWILNLDPWTALGDSGRRYHLRSEAMSSLALVAAANAPLVPPSISVRHALAAHCERRWQDLPALSIEATMQDPAATARWLIDQRLIPCDGRALEIVSNATLRLRARRELQVDPVGFFQQMPQEAACQLLLTPSDRVLKTGRGGDGLPSLAQGWKEPEDEISRLHSPIGTLRLLVPAGASALHCFCAEDLHQADLAIYVDGNFVPVAIDRASRRELFIPLHHRRETDPVRVITVEFIEQRANDVPGFGLTGFKVGCAPRLDGGMGRQALPDALSSAGFHPIGNAPPSLQDTDGVWLQALVAERYPAKLLLLAEDAPAMLHRLQLRLPDVMLAAASTGSERVERPPAGGRILHADFASAADWPIIGNARFDLIHLQDLVHASQLSEKFRWLARHLSYCGILSGCEQSVAHARHVVSALGRGMDQRAFTFILEGSRWRAIPHAHWRA